MPKLRNSLTGVVVETSESIAETLGSEWHPFTAETSATRKTPKVTAK